jgi:Rieske Fe-S protein
VTALCTRSATVGDYLAPGVSPDGGGRAALKANLAVARHFIGDRLRPAPADTPASIAPGTGAVVRIDGHRCAVYRDDADQLHAVSAVCTHLGCFVAFNDVERTWDCPCHGSRFSTDGTVLHGPAAKPLPPRKIPADNDVGYRAPPTHS